MNPNKNPHDLDLPDWGPYTKKYIGISHVADKEKGIRFDLSVFPGYYRRKVDVPNVMWESDYHPWDAAPDLSFYTHRHELEWKERVYSDISFVRMARNQNLVRCELVNNTTSNQSLVLYWMGSIHFPSLKAHGEPMEAAEIRMPDKGIWIDALDYDHLEYATKRHNDFLTYDGYFRGEERVPGFVNGSGLGQGFGKETADRVRYRLNVAEPFRDAVLMIRYRLKAKDQNQLILSGLIQSDIKLTGSGGIDCCCVPIGAMESKEYVLELASAGGDPVCLDGLMIVERENLEQVQFTLVDWDPQPEMLAGPVSNSLILSYKHCDQYYGLLWFYEQFEIRQFAGKDLDLSLRHNMHHHVRRSFQGEGKGHYANIFMRPVTVEPNGRKIINGMVCHGSLEEVRAMIREFSLIGSESLCDRTFVQAKNSMNQPKANPSGGKYEFGQQRLAATTLTNVVFPVYARRSYIKHYTPGRWWDSLYTWDSGFIGLGLSELSTARAEDCLQSYLTEPGDPHAAFIHHGSMVPVQHYLFLELWNKTQSSDFLEKYYAALKQYYLFYSGNYESSTTRVLKSNLLKTWDYFYNSGGWDDYPPQVYVHQNRLESKVAPVINTAHCIRIAKILRMAAHELGFTEDIDFYGREIEVLTNAIQRHAWDEESGYYGYVCHNDDGEPSGILKYKDEVNFNMGLDGAYPLVAGICDSLQTGLLLERLFDASEIWCPIGLSTVSQKAPYYLEEGYWNGAVWMPHQWFFWKTMLDLGRLDLARQIARTGLEVWEREVRESYNCYEHFVIKTGRGAGWHHFGGLSNPVLNWFSAYHRPGTITGGFDVWMQSKEFNPEFSSLTAVIKYYGNNRIFGIVVTMDPRHEYKVVWNGTEQTTKTVENGVVELELDAVDPDREGVLLITAKEQE